MPRSWDSISSRERRLVVMTGLLILVAAGYTLTTRALDYLAFLDASIAGVENDLAYYSEKADLSEAVDRQFEQVAADHSSEWTRPEIHDRLRGEIMRLAQRHAPSLEAEPPSTPVRGGALLVDIHELPMGTLDEGTVGYRQYRISFSAQPAPITDLVVFLQRLLESPQALRIDGLELQRRNPRATSVTASVSVTRTIIDDAPRQPVEAGDIRNGSFETWDPVAAGFPGWRTEGLAVTPDSSLCTHSRQCLNASSKTAGAMLYQRVQVAANVAHDIFVDVQAGGPGTLAIVDERSGESLDSAIDLPGDGECHRYHVRFTVPGKTGEVVSVRVPCIALQNEGDSIRVDNTVLTVAGDSP